MRILVDQDGVLANWGAGWDRALDMYGEAASGLPRHAQQTSFNLMDGRTDEECEIIDTIFAQPGFYADLEPIEGALLALNQFVRMGHDVRIVTSPWIPNPTCASDKLNWVLRYLGPEWAERVILTSDKTLVIGDILIDDKPAITGAGTQFWQHVIFEQPYNVNVKGKRRILDWSDWPAILEVTA